MTNEEVIQEAHRVRALHNAPAIIVISLQEDACPFGFAIMHGLEDKVLPVLADKLREIAGHLDRQMAEIKAHIVLSESKTSID